MTFLTPGATTGVDTYPLNVTVSYSPVSCAALDVLAFLITASGRVPGDSDMCVFGQKAVNNGAVKPIYRWLIP